MTRALPGLTPYSGFKNMILIIFILKLTQVNGQLNLWIENFLELQVNGQLNLWIENFLELTF